MNCEQAQLALLDFDIDANLKAHLATCEGCRKFHEAQLRLDARLLAAIPPLELSPKFELSLPPHSRWTWSDSLPDIAHVIGSAAAVVTLVFVFPQNTKQVTSIGIAFTAVTWLIQALVRERLESDA